MERYGQTRRKVIYLYSGEPPAPGEGILGISINVDTADLERGRADYVTNSVQDPDNLDACGRYCSISPNARRAGFRRP